MPRKVYTEQFKRDAVAMFESNPDTSMRKVAEELGINRSTLGCWYKQFGTNVAKDEERDILRKAAKYFAEETTW